MGDDLPKAPRGMVRLIVLLDSLGILFWGLTFVDLKTLYGSVACYGLAALLSLCLPCRSAEERFKRGMRTVCWVHACCIMFYIVATALAAAAGDEISSGSAVAIDGNGTDETPSDLGQMTIQEFGHESLEVGAMVTLVIALVLNGVSLLVSLTLLCRIRFSKGDVEEEE